MRRGRGALRRPAGIPLRGRGRTRASAAGGGRSPTENPRAARSKMPELDLLTPRRELLDAGWLSLLGSQARLLEVHLLLWAPDLTLILSAPPEVRAAELPRISELARQSMFERRTLWSGAGGRHPLLAVPICSADDVVAAITARPLAQIEPLGSPTGSPTSAADRVVPSAAGSAPSGGDRAADTGPWRDPQHTSHPSPAATWAR